MFASRNVSARALLQAAGSWSTLVAPRASLGRHGVREFGRHPKHDPKPFPIDRQLPKLEDLTAHITKTMHPVEEVKEKRAHYLYLRSLPLPIREETLHGCRTRLSPEATVRRWWYIDAEGKVLGRLANQIVKIVMGKHKPIYDPAKVLGDFVVVVNAEKVHLTGKKAQQNMYRYHTGWPGGLVEIPHEKMLSTKPIEVLRRAVAGMLPKNLLRKERLKLMRIFAGPDHPHLAEDPEPIPDFVKTPSPWVVKKERVVKKDDEDYVFVRDEAGNPWEQGTDQTGKKYSVEELEAMLAQPTEVYESAWEEANLEGKIKPPPKKK